ncbi:hypothetical protein HPB50_022900 [Hyalomma asiaticum]|uniref:Uncharacterized protein n=1 Tax=Hyalomma asiaticum TaxID=266040 RepID=A0ACB7SKN0_HYAAI|nr:hypothetical protein HPB50_022900 [Hyalomma asiaticum]
MARGQPATMRNSSGVLVHPPGFSPEKSDFEVCVECSEPFATAKKIKATKRMLLTLIGEAAFLTFRNRLFPNTPGALASKMLQKSPRTDYSPRRSIAERFTFYCRDQRRSEGTCDFVVEIKQRATVCNFGTFLGEAIRGRLVELHDDAIICKLLARKGEDLTIEKAYSSAFGVEAAQEQSNEARRNDAADTAGVPENDVKWQRKSATSVFLGFKAQSVEPEHQPNKTGADEPIKKPTQLASPENMTQDSSEQIRALLVSFSGRNRNLVSEMLHIIQTHATSQSSSKH